MTPRIARIALCAAGLLALCAAAARADDSKCLDAKSPELRGDIYVGTAEGGFLGPMQAQPGEKRTLRLWVRNGPSWRSPDACVRWRLDAGDPATVDEKTGALTISPDAKDGVELHATAELAGARAPYQGILKVYRPDSNPLAGMWREVAQLKCGSGEELTSGFREIREFEIQAGGFFSVTWHPFESYRDYWGEVQFDVAKRTVSFKINNGNHVPDAAKLEGKFAREGKRLKLEGVWLGDAPALCGHVFELR